MKTSILSLTVFLSLCFFNSCSQKLLSEASANNLRVETAICASDKYIWIGTNMGLIQRNIRTGKEWLLTHEKTDLPSNIVTCIVCLADGQTYIGTTNGILLWDNYAFMVINSENSELPENYIQEMFLDDKENLWIRTKNCEMLKGVGRYIKSFKLQPSKVSDLNIDSDQGPDIVR